MTTITIPKKFAEKDDLIVIPRKQYESLVHFRKFYVQLDKDLNRSIKNYRAGKYHGPFQTMNEGKEFLESRKRR